MPAACWSARRFRAPEARWALAGRAPGLDRVTAVGVGWLTSRGRHRSIVPVAASAPYAARGFGGMVSLRVEPHHHAHVVGGPEALWGAGALAGDPTAVGRDR